MKIMVAIPCGDALDVRFVDSLTSMLFHVPSDVSIAVQFESGSLIYEARNNLAKRAIENEFDYILWLDSDVVFNGDLLKRMIESLGDKEFLSGLYFTRKMPLRPTLFETCDFVDQEDGSVLIDWKYLKHIPDDILQIAACGFGCVLMKTSLAAEIFQMQGLPFSPVYGLGEDLSFCLKARKLGHKLYADPRILVGHVAQLVVGDQTVLEDWNLNNSKED